MSMTERMKRVNEKECPVDILRKEVVSSKCNDCGKCVFGYEGVTQLQMILGDATEKKGRGQDLALMKDLCGMMRTQCLCEDGEDVADAVSYALEHYAQEFEAHVAKKGCTAGVCKKFMTYHILAENCTGCEECVDACEEDAIIGKKRFVHVIEQKECTQCGACMDVCEEDAIVRAGAVKPRCPKKPIPCKRK